MRLYALMGLILIKAATGYAAVATQVATTESKNFAAQLAVAKNTALPMGSRWSALLNAADLASSEQIDEIRNFTKSTDWYMRNAAMVALAKVDQSYAVEEAKKLVKDKALVVRSAAIDMLAVKYTTENRKILADELAQTYNFKGKQSLWIRPQIMKHLSSRATSGDRAFFARYLFDSDNAIGELAAETLEKITDVNFSGKNQLADWRQYVKQNAWF